MPDFSHLTAQQIMQTRPICARPDEDLSELARRLVESNINGAPVVDNDRLVGVVSRSDVMRVRVLYETLDSQVENRLEPPDVRSEDFSENLRGAFQGFRDRLAHLKVRDVMRTEVISCSPDTPVPQVAQQMLDQHIHRIVVVENQRPVGLISSLDIVRLVAQAATS